MYKKLRLETKVKKYSKLKKKDKCIIKLQTCDLYFGFYSFVHL